MRYGLTHGDVSGPFRPVLNARKNKAIRYKEGDHEGVGSPADDPLDPIHRRAAVTSTPVVDYHPVIIGEGQWALLCSRSGRVRAWGAPPRKDAFLREELRVTGSGQCNSPGGDPGVLRATGPGVPPIPPEVPEP